METTGSFYVSIVTVYILITVSYTANTMTNVIGNASIYTKKLSRYPFKMATIDYSVYIQQASGYKVTLKFYTVEDLATRCSNNYGQLGNENLHIPLTPMSTGSSNCKLSPNGSDSVHCSGTTTVQDFEPKNYFFEFSLDCRDIRSSLKSSTRLRTLEGISYNISIYDETNDTACYPLEKVQGFDCSEFYPKFTFPNLVGDSDIHEGMKSLQSLYSSFHQTYNQFQPSLTVCYKYMLEASCNIYVPRCHDNQMTVLCREMCEDLLSACGWISACQSFNCKYLPSKTGSVPCFYKPVICDKPEIPANAQVIADTVGSNKTYNVQSSQVTYACKDNYQMEGSNTVICLYSGQWSERPRCVPTDMFLFRTVVPAVVGLVVAGKFIVICVVFNWKRKRRNAMRSRGREFDAFVSFNFDGENDFVMERILPEMEENHSPPVKLCLHSRDFTPGIKITENMMNAIRNSNSAIIVMSQNFVNSPLCREEFELCIRENESDPAFKIFVIMMEPHKSLTGTTDNMDKLFSQRTYLEVEDPHLCGKIAEHLIRMQNQPELCGCFGKKEEEKETHSKKVNDIEFHEISHC